MYKRQVQYDPDVLTGYDYSSAMSGLIERAAQLVCMGDGRIVIFSVFVHTTCSPHDDVCAFVVDYTIGPCTSWSDSVFGESVDHCVVLKGARTAQHLGDIDLDVA